MLFSCNYHPTAEYAKYTKSGPFTDPERALFSSLPRASSQIKRPGQNLSVCCGFAGAACLPNEDSCTTYPQAELECRGGDPARSRSSGGKGNHVCRMGQAIAQSSEADHG